MGLPRPDLKSALKHIRLPSGWAGLSFASKGPGRLVITEIPKACFSSASFGAIASNQVADVHPGDEIALINGMSLAELAQRIGSAGDALNTCSAGESPHAPGSVGKLQSPPCVSCDFVRRHKEQGLAVALQLWMRAVKREMPITLGVQAALPEPPAVHLDSGEIAKAPAPGAVEAPKKSTGTAGQAKAASKAKAAPAAKVQVSPAGPAAQEPVATAKAFPVRYNPLKPAAAGTSKGPAAEAPKPKAAPVAAAELIKLSSGLQYEVLPASSVDGQEATKQAELGAEVLLRFSLQSSSAKKPKVLERGEVCVRLGEAEVLDGWVDGDVDMEEVMENWAPAVVGMRVGERRKVRVPPQLGFKDGGESVPAGTELIWEVALKRIKP